MKVRFLQDRSSIDGREFRKDTEYDLPATEAKHWTERKLAKPVNGKPAPATPAAADKKA